jgi:hypothetical protein
MRSCNVWLAVSSKFVLSRFQYLGSQAWFYTQRLVWKIHEQEKDWGEYEHWNASYIAFIRRSFLSLKCYHNFIDQFGSEGTKQEASSLRAKDRGKGKRGQ